MTAQQPWGGTGCAAAETGHDWQTPGSDRCTGVVRGGYRRTDSAAVAVGLAIAADALAAAPTLEKARVDPRTENPVFFALISVGGAVTLLTLDRWTLVDWAFPVPILLFPGLLAALILRWRARDPAAAP